MATVSNTKLSVTNGMKGKHPRLPFLKIKNAVLGRKYELSIVFTTPSESRRLNRIYRGKNKPANVLSFPLSKEMGEIFLCMPEINKSEKEFGCKGKKLAGFFLIHALAHLKGHRHGSTMEKTEARFRRAFGI